MAKRKKRKKRQWESRNKRKLRRQLRAEPAYKDLEIIETPNEEKMSAVILEFIEPYRDVATSKQRFESLIVLAMVAWNASIMEGASRQEMLDGFKETIQANSGQEWLQDVDHLLTKLIQRKERYFADNKRIILDYRVSESRHEYNVAVVSTS